MMTKQEQAQEFFRKGYNCSQSVFATFCQDLGMDLETSLKLSSSFGGGMGGLRQVCGAVTAMFMIAGLKYGYVDSQDINLKNKHYKLIQNLAKQFSDKFGSIICKELLLSNANIKKDISMPEKRTLEYYKVRPCERFVVYATELTEKMLKDNV
ncbi:MAG: C_GCAxxG_C_C family protein [Elusimicrobia bacterium]|nr:C_GCAxxG_C_C family protein [Elusimicrobiota bacterium]